MSPSVQQGDILFAWPSPYTKEAPSRGDVVVIDDLTGQAVRSMKRVVGLPGEKIGLADGVLLINGEYFEEPYLGGLPSSLGLDKSEWRIESDECFVMGDNRSHSTDSREYGPVKIETIVGKAMFRCWPVRRLGKINLSAPS